MARSTEKAAVKDVHKNVRYERKFVYENISSEDLISTEVLVNSFCFREIFHRRTVNNIYYDDQAMSFYHQNVAGDEYRDKYRLRWYGDNFAEIVSPTLEIKKKMGAVGDKFSFKLPDFEHHLKKNSSMETQSTILSEIEKKSSSELYVKLSRLSASLYNSYERRYFLSDCSKFRITVDYNMCFYNPFFKNYVSSKIELSDVILELKYNVKDDKEARSLTQALRARLSKNSKYVRGINLINHSKET